MAPVLEKNVYLLLDQDDDWDDDDMSDTHEKSSIWIQEGSIFRPSMDLSIVDKITPGMYVVEANQNYGIFCKKLEVLSDKLYTFKESYADDLLKEIDLFWKKKDLYKEHNFLHKRGILLEGFPGTGKSSIISLLSKELIKTGGIVFKITSPSNLGFYLTFMQDNFRQIQPDTPIVTIIEDIDKYDDSIEVLLDFLDGKSSINHHVVIATTNNTSEIPNTLLRPSRLDYILEVGFPSISTKIEYLQNKGLDEEKAKEIANNTEFCSFADLKEIYTCIHFLDYKIDDAIKKVTTPLEKKNYLNIPKNNKNLGL